MSSKVSYIQASRYPPGTCVLKDCYWNFILHVGDLSRYRSIALTACKVHKKKLCFVLSNIIWQVLSYLLIYFCSTPSFATISACIELVSKKDISIKTFQSIWKCESINLYSVKNKWRHVDQKSVQEIKIT